MAETKNDPAAAARRLEAALERIAGTAGRPDPVKAELAVRLDALIAELRAALEDHPAG